METTERRLYWVWAALIQRCENPANPGYKNYGARGLSVCPEWRGSFAAFKADMGLPPEGMSIERNDPSRGYSPDNCRWATRKEQNRNRPQWCRYYVVDGRRMTMREAWERHCDRTVTYRSFVKRLVTRGWSIDRAIGMPAMHGGRAV